MERQNIAWLDSMRGLACAIVVVAHIVSFHPVVGIYANGCGKIGVWLFFAMSAYLLMYHAKNRFISLNTLVYYYLKKVLRLYPIYVIGLIVAFFCGLITEPVSIIKHIFLLEGVGHFWYMAVIIKFYIIAPLLEWLYLKSEKVFCVAVIILGLVIEAIFPFTEYMENSIYLIWYLPVFLLGMLTYIVVDHTKRMESKYIWDVLVITLVIGICVLTPLARQVLFHIQPGSFLQNQYLLVGGIWCLIILAVGKSSLIKKWLEQCGVLKFIGKISYPVYVLHYTILFYLMKNNVSWGVAVALMLIISGVGGWILKKC